MCLGTGILTNYTFVGNLAEGGAGGAGANGGDAFGGGVSVAIGSILGFADTSSLSLSDSTLIRQCRSGRRPSEADGGTDGAAARSS